MIEYARYSLSYMFYYSERPGTLAARKYKDDIPEEIKKSRLEDVIKVQRQISFEDNLKDIDKTYEILVEGESKKSTEFLRGRTSQNKEVIFPKKDKVSLGDYVFVKITKATSATLLGFITDQE